MLIPWYSVQANKVPNHTNLSTNTDLHTTYQWLKFPTLLECPLYSKTPQELNALFDEQEKQMLKELSIQKQYNLVTKQSERDTINQYKLYFFYEGFAYERKALIEGSIKRFNLSTTTNEESILEDQPPFVTPIYKTQYDKTVGISVQSIRNITGFTYYPIPPWSPTATPVYVKWQHQMIEDTSDILIIDGSRQMGKSFWMAELLVEESFVPWADLLVAAFLQKTTNVILRYIEKFTADFEEGTFEVHSKDWYIKNTITWVSIHFRTLSDDAKNVLGLTLRLIVIDEAQEVTKEIYDDALKPTLTTTGGRMILIGTAIEDTSSYMYYMIQECIRSTNYNNPWQKTLRHIKVSVLENPLVHPKERMEIMAKKDEPATLRQYFNRWWKQSDSAFSLKFVPQSQYVPEQQWHIIIWYDPARQNDRSAYCIGLAYNNKLTILASWEVKEHMKKDWINQASFHKAIREPYESSFKSLSSVMDITWVGDWVLTIFRQNKLPINHTVRYTSGQTDSEPVPDSFNVPKHLLINNALDMIENGIVTGISEFNPLLKEEFSYCWLKEMRSGTMALDTNFYDDIINAFMLVCYIARKKRYLYRVTPQATKDAFHIEMQLYKNKNVQNSKQSQSYF